MRRRERWRTVVPDLVVEVGRDAGVEELGQRDHEALAVRAAGRGARCAQRIRQVWLVENAPLLPETRIAASSEGCNPDASESRKLTSTIPEPLAPVLRSFLALLRAWSSVVLRPRQASRSSAT